MLKTASLVIAILFSSLATLGQASDAALKAVIEKDRSAKTADGKLMTLAANEHLARGTVYFDNRAFPQAREHFSKIIDNFPTAPEISGALWKLGRSYYWEREYKKCIPTLARVVAEFPGTKDGRESLYFQGSCHVRLGQNAEASKLFQQYVTMYPTGERIDGAYLNAIDALRESKQYTAADEWIEKARARWPGSVTETNALHARLRMQLYRELWADAEATAALIMAQGRFTGSMTSTDEVTYLRAFAAEKGGKKAEAMRLYNSIPEKATSYYSGLAADKIAGGNGRVKTIASVRATDFPTPHRVEILQFAKKHKIDPRFILAIMKQESSFRTDVKSPSAARGLLQLVMDTALKYNKKAGFANLQPDDLYIPRTNIAIGTEYIADLKGQFNGMYEAIAASYNGGEDNAARWLNRSKPKDPAIFSAEVGFPETKNYVFKVLTNMRIYQQLYDENLVKK